MQDLLQDVGEGLIMRGLCEGPKIRKGAGQMQEEQAWEELTLHVFMVLSVKALVSVFTCVTDSVRVQYSAPMHMCVHVHTHLPIGNTYLVSLLTGPGNTEL